MDKRIIEKLIRISEEEQRILAGEKDVKKEEYTLSKEFIVNRKILFDADRQIQLRLHTRFVDFPEHGHDYLEFMYVYAGSITHRIGGEDITLHEGDILFLNKHIRHSIKKAELRDIGINFIAADSFLQYILHNVENNPILCNFLTKNFNASAPGEYLHFKTRDNFPIRNLLDNLIYAIANREDDNALIPSQIISLLFSYLSYYKDTLANAYCSSSPNEQLRAQTTLYLEKNYPNATLGELADNLGYTVEYLSRRIHSIFGMTFRHLLIRQRLKVVERLLTTTDMNVTEIVETAGYENQTYFYTLFKEEYGMTPHRYRKEHKK